MYSYRLSRSIQRFKYKHMEILRELILWYKGRIGLPILLQGNTVCGPILEKYKALTDTWMWKLGLRPSNFQKRIHKSDFPCSVRRNYNEYFLGVHDPAALWGQIIRQSIHTSVKMKMETNFRLSVSFVNDFWSSFYCLTPMFIDTLKPWPIVSKIFISFSTAKATYLGTGHFCVFCARVFHLV
jgi:hypothetical protein